METFTLDELHAYLSTILPVEADRIRDQIVSDYADYLQQLSANKNDIFLEKRQQAWSIPYSYREAPLNFFVLFHLARIYLNGIAITRSIAENFRETELPAIVLRDEINGTERTYLLRSRTPEQLGRAEEDVRAAFITLGRSIAGETFNIDDFF